MIPEARRIAVPRESPLAQELRAATDGDRPLELDTGDAIYQVYISRTKTTAPSPDSVERSIAGIRAAAGSWKDVDIEGFRADLAERRRVHTRLPVKL